MVFAISLRRQTRATGGDMVKVSHQLRAMIKVKDASLYRIAKDSDVDWGTIQRFLDGTRPNIRIETVDRLCECLGLELRVKKGKAARDG
jgi:hypothetical protein